MKKSILFVLAVCMVGFINCNAQKVKSGANIEPLTKVIDQSLAFSVKQYKLMSEVMLPKTDSLPRTIDKAGHLTTSDSRWWCSGFYPGCLWYLYEGTKDPMIKKYAKVMTARVEREKFTTSNHDVGFMINCSFGNGLRITNEKSYNEVLLTAAKSLSTRFNPKVGLIQSWGANAKWKYPVIIDNMMNLELLMNAFKLSHDSSFYKIAVSHADLTMKNHYRSDYSCYHVVSYNPETGEPMIKQTHQGAFNESAWARGQAWGLYGYTMMYRETKLDRYLQQAKHIAGFLLNHPNLPVDKIPYWDFNAPGIPDAKRDASAGALMASALIELSQYVDQPLSKKFLAVAETEIRSLSSPAYRAALGENGNFIIKHNVGSMPHNSEVDVPLTYADYYYLEAMLRYKNLKKH